MEYFLVKQIGCGNLPVQFVGTKVAFVTQITTTYQWEWGPWSGEGVRQVRGWVGCCPLVGSRTDTEGQTSTPSLRSPCEEATQLWVED